MVGQEGMTLVYVSAGKFRMGSRQNDFGSQSDEKPQRSVTVSAFWIDQTEVTNALYRRCIQARVCERVLVPETWDVYHNDPYYEDYPAVFVDWENAKAYCEWVGRRLPTEAEWEKAARGPHARLYPWGNEAPAGHLLNYDNKIGHPTAVKSYEGGASPYGAYDMAGNVFEWVSDWYSYDYYRTATSFNPLGPETGQRHIRRGGSYESNASLVRTANRVNVLHREGGFADTGFRCALAAPS
jgi:formylglycine-generating enzyme required for sulfatase activity